MPRSSTNPATSGTSLRLTLDERRRLDRAAAALGLGPSGFAREAVLAAIRPSAPDATIVDRRAIRARLLARWTLEIGRLADEVRTLAAAPAGQLDHAALATVADRIARVHAAVVETSEAPR
jgi:uncharacterized protein (DUF1778 family)